MIRRERLYQSKEAELTGLLDQPRPSIEDTLRLDGEIADDRLRMMFVDHPKEAADHFRASLQRTDSQSEREFLSKRIRECEEHSRAGSRSGG